MFLLSLGFFGPLDVLRWAEVSVLILAFFRLPVMYLPALFLIRGVVGFGVVWYIRFVLLTPRFHEARELACRLLREGLASQASPPSTVRLLGAGTRGLVRESMYRAAFGAIVFSWCAHAGWLSALVVGGARFASVAIYRGVSSTTLDRLHAAFVLARHAEQYRALAEAYRVLR